MISIKNLLWLFPFAMFAAGYLFASLFLNTPTLPAPDLIGKNIYEATRMCSEQQLHLYILEEKIDEQIPSGTIISQRPHQGTSIKTNQALYIITTKAPACLKAPTFLGKNYKDIQDISNHNHIKIRTHFLSSSGAPDNSCIAQWPHPGQELPHKKMIIYCAQPEQKLYVFPNFLQTCALTIDEFLQSYEIKPTYYFQGKPFIPSCKNELSSYKVIQQRPLSGTFVDMQKKLPVQFELEFIDQNSSALLDNH